MNDTLNKPTPQGKLRGIYGLLPFGTEGEPYEVIIRNPAVFRRRTGHDQVPEAMRASRVPSLVVTGQRANPDVPEKNRILVILQFQWPGRGMRFVNRQPFILRRTDQFYPIV